MNISISQGEESPEVQFPEVKRISAVAIQYQESNNERRWRLSHLKDQFEALELHKLFNRYLQRISHGYFSQFLSLQIMLITAHFIVLLATVVPSQNIIPDLILYGIISIVSIILLIITDLYVKKYPFLLKYLAGIAFIMTFFMNAFIPFYYRKKAPFGNLRPAYTAYLIISNYIFLNIHNDLVAFVVGLFVSLFHIVMLVLVTYEGTDRLYQRIGSDSTYLICINCLGLYFRYMNEIVIRRSFLDRRSCVESTHQLKFEEEQENHLMSSIIPQHIIAKVRKTLTEYIGHYITHQTIPKEKPFEDLYVEEHPNVTILFADIVNYTTMTTQLNVITLLDVLNELFGRFDEASEKLKVLRIKFLGDCYYCVAGLPPDPAPNHAEACVDLGLKMISIIADIRRRTKLPINMRIGIHSGKISCGIIGTIKWQYDIWSTDVDTANKMETEGTPGMVHITKETRALLRKSYNIALSRKVVNGERTYLIEPEATKPTAANGSAGRILETRISQNEESDQNNNESNQRRVSIYTKKPSTAREPRTSITPNSRSFSLITNYQLQESLKADNERRQEGKRHTVPSTGERRASGSANPGMFQKRISDNVRISMDRRLTGNEFKRKTSFMHNNIKRYNERLELTNKELEETIEKMLLSKFEQWFQASDMYRILLVFKNLKSELDFIKMPDPLFKYYLVGVVILLLLVFVLENLTLARWTWPSWPFYTTVGVIVILFIPLSWTHFIWTRYVAKFENHLPTNKLISALFHTSKFITNNVLIRLVIYTVVCVLFCLCVLTEWIDCYEVNGTYHLRGSSLAKNNFLLLITADNLEETEETQAQCIIPWHMTETFALAIIMSFSFLRMYMWLKVLYAAIIAAVYAFCILEYSGEFYGDSQTFNYDLPPQTSHIMGILFLTAILHMVDRQTEYMNRIDHLWYKNLVEKEEQANSVHTVNKMLLKNILPIHVADLYLNVNRHSSEEVYNESYDDAAVMFASITNFSVEEMGPGFLKIMSAIISEFDMLLVRNTYGRPIEKIKIAKWTYMAACGLAPGQGNTENIRRDLNDHVVISLVKFAACLMQKLKAINAEIMQEMKLRIGVSHGFIAAGVVGSKKPLYDIWGDPVNMASRMDTTGLVDHIQVLQETAEIIESFGFVCHYRGDIRVKGREGLVPTYFVALDEEFELVRRVRSD